MIIMCHFSEIGKGDDLDVSGTPVIHYHHAKDVLLSLGDGDRLAELIARPNEVGLHGGENCCLVYLTLYGCHGYHFQLEVQEFAWPKHRWLLRVRPCLSYRSVNGSTRYHHGGGPAVVANREVEPGGEQELRVRTHLEPGIVISRVTSLA